MVSLDANSRDDDERELTIELVRRVPSTAMVLVPRTSLPTTALARRFPSYDLEALPRPVDPRLVLLDHPRSTRASSFRVLRDMLVAKGLPRLAAVSSALSGDGKTTCVANLALALAEQPSTRVLPVDGNVLSPELGKMFRIDLKRHVATAELDLPFAPYSVVEIMPSLDVCAIPWTRNEPLPRVEQHRFDAMLERLGDHAYDYILIDTPALRGNPVTLPILSAAGGTLLLARSGSTTGRDLRRAAEQLPTEKRLGIALMDAPSAD